MTGSIALDVFIGLIAIYLLYSLFASILMEAIAKYFGLRARVTVKIISKILDDSEMSSSKSPIRLISLFNGRIFNSLHNRPFTSLFYAHPNIKNLGSDNLYRKPSNISAEIFANTFIQLLRGDKFFGQQDQTVLIKENLKLGTSEEGNLTLPLWYSNSSNKYKPKEIEKLVEISASKNTLTIHPLTVYQVKQLLFDSNSDIDLFRKKVVTWYVETCNRAEGWYIKQTRSILFLLGFIIALIFNVDTIGIVEKLSTDSIIRGDMIDFASSLQKEGNVDGAYADISVEIVGKLSSNIQEANLILGGGECGKYAFLGYLITATAISLGASFWFDLLGKIMSIKQSGKKNNSASSIDIEVKEGKKDEPVG